VKKAMMAGISNMIKGYHSDRLVARATIEKAAIITTKLIAVKNR
jgi:ribosomal protein S8E